MDALLRPVTNRICWMPFETSSSTTYWTMGLRATGNISLGCDLVAGSSRVPWPATGISALLITSIDYRPNLTGSRSRSIVGEDKAKYGRHPGTTRAPQGKSRPDRPQVRGGGEAARRPLSDRRDCLGASGRDGVRRAF